MIDLIDSIDLMDLIDSIDLTPPLIDLPGLHIHTGTSCASADKVGGHYWNTNTLVPDPWTPMKHNPSTIARTSSGRYVKSLLYMLVVLVV